MIKDFFTITDEEIKYLRTHSFYVAEKLDMVYFKVEINDQVAIALKPPKFTAISDIDCITNSVNKNIRDFVFTHIMPMRQDLVGKYGPIRVGFFFAPVKQPRKILYENSRKDTMYINDIDMLSDNGRRTPFKTSLSQLLEMQMDIDRTSIEGLDVIAKTKYPNYFIKTNMVTWSNTHMKPKPTSDTEWHKMKFTDMDGEDFRRAIHQILLCQDDPVKAASMFCDRTSFFVKMPSGNTLAESEGLVIRCANKQWQIRIKNAQPNIDKSTKKIYRDMVLNSLAHDLLSQTDIIDRIGGMKTEYVDKISLLFKEFISVTNIFSKLYIDPDDLLPPIEGYIGDMDMSVFNDPEVKEMCETNETYKNIMRMFLHTFTHSVMDGKFKDMTEEDRNLMNRLTIALGYRNYADIALSRTK